MKQFKNAVAVAIAAAGLYSISAMAGTAVHWAGSDAGGTKDVKWKVVQPSRLDFTVTPAQVTFVAVDGGVNGSYDALEPGAGTWKNDGDAVKVKTSHLTNSVFDAYAPGDSKWPRIERLRYTFTVDDVSGIELYVNGQRSWPSHIHGHIRAVIQTQDPTTSKWSAVSGIGSVKSTRFTDTLTVTKYAV